MTVWICARVFCYGFVAPEIHRMISCGCVSQYDPGIYNINKNTRTDILTLKEVRQLALWGEVLNLKYELLHWQLNTKQWLNLSVNQAVMSDFPAVSAWVTGTYRKEQGIVTSLSLCCNCVTGKAYMDTAWMSHGPMTAERWDGPHQHKRSSVDVGHVVMLPSLINLFW